MTAYEGEPMFKGVPTHEWEGLLEEWARQYPKFTKGTMHWDLLGEWWLSRFSSHLSTIEEKVKGMRAKGVDKVPEVMEKDHIYNLMNESTTIGYNLAIDDILSILKKTK